MQLGCSFISIKPAESHMQAQSEHAARVCWVAQNASGPAILPCSAAEHLHNRVITEQAPTTLPLKQRPFKPCLPLWIGPDASLYLICIRTGATKRRSTLNPIRQHSSCIPASLLQHLLLPQSSPPSMEGSCPLFPLQARCSQLLMQLPSQTGNLFGQASANLMNRAAQIFHPISHPLHIQEWGRMGPAFRPICIQE